MLTSQKTKIFKTLHLTPIEYLTLSRAACSHILQNALYA